MCDPCRVEGVYLVTAQVPSREPPLSRRSAKVFVCHKFPCFIWFCFHVLSPSPVISDPATPTCLAISSSLSPGIPRPSLHLQLISSLVPLYLYLSTFTCSLPDCLVCFAKLSRDLYVNHKPDYPVFRPWTVPRIPFSLPAPRLTCLPVLSDLPVLTLPACPPITDYSACSLSDGLLNGESPGFDSACLSPGLLCLLPCCISETLG